jgi:murein DD-endopeptidase / murein LD-carboxypeptidase
MRMRVLFYICLAASVIAVACKQKQKAPPVVKQLPVTTAPAPVRKDPAPQSEFRQKLQISDKEFKTSKLYTFSEEWYGVPYRYGGCDKNGVDCSCFANLLYQQVYSKVISRSANEIFKSCDQLSLEELQQGDLLFFKIGGNIISHVGVYLKGRYFIHSSTSKGVILNSLDEAYYKKYFFCAGKLRKI